MIWENTGLLCETVGLFCGSGYVFYFWQAGAPSPYASFQKNTGLFCENLGLFCGSGCVFYFSRAGLPTPYTHVLREHRPLLRECRALLWEWVCFVFLTRSRSLEDYKALFRECGLFCGNGYVFYFSQAGAPSEDTSFEKLYMAVRWLWDLCLFMYTSKTWTTFIIRALRSVLFLREDRALRSVPVCVGI